MIKCPSCDAAISTVQIKPLKGIVSARSSLKCIAHTCPLCLHVLSVQVDPLALQSDTVNAVVAALRKAQ